MNMKLFTIVGFKRCTQKTDTRKITVHSWIITGATRKITVCSSTFYSVLQYILRCASVHFTVWHSKNYIYVKITGMNRENYGVLQYILRCDSNFYILHHEKVLCSIFGHIPPPHELWLVVLVGN